MPDRTSQSSHQAGSRSRSGGRGTKRAHSKTVTRTGSTANAASRKKVRIIGGEWRGRWIYFHPIEGLRPTGDRMRETLFNWLQTRIHGARCLDLFAGTGALGIEAVSRGAAMSALIERNPVVCQQLEQQIQTLGMRQPDMGRRLPVHTTSAEAFLRAKDEGDDGFDIVFVDPPFSADTQIEILLLLQQSGWLAPEALVYVEAPTGRSLEARLPSKFDVYRTQKQGKVQCLLLQFQSSPNSHECA